MICGTRGPGWRPTPEHEHRTDEATIRCQAEELERLRVENTRLEAQVEKFSEYVRQLWKLADAGRSLL